MIVVALTGAPGRRTPAAARRAHGGQAQNGELVGVHVRSADGLARTDPAGLEAQRRLLAELGGRYAEVAGVDEAKALVQFARAENATQLIMGASVRSRLYELFNGSVINRVIRDAAPIDVHIISPTEQVAVGLPPLARRHRPASVPPPRRKLGLVLATVGIMLTALVLLPLRSSLQLPGALLVLLLAVVVIARISGAVPAVLGTLVAALAADFFFTPPPYSFRIAHPADTVAVVVFFAVAGLVSLFVDQLARRGLQVERARAEVDALARLAAGSVLSGVEPLPDLVGELRRTFDLASVAILAREQAAWRVVAAAGAPCPLGPRSARSPSSSMRGTCWCSAGTPSRRKNPASWLRSSASCV